MKKLLLTSVLMLSGCASLPPGVEMTDAERAACAESGCSVWTRAELEQLVRAAMLKGYQAGKGSL